MLTCCLHRPSRVVPRTRHHVLQKGFTDQATYRSSPTASIPASIHYVIQRVRGHGVRHSGRRRGLWCSMGGGFVARWQAQQARNAAIPGSPTPCEHDRARGQFNSGQLDKLLSTDESHRLHSLQCNPVVWAGQEVAGQSGRHAVGCTKATGTGLCWPFTPTTTATKCLWAIAAIEGQQC